jgi:hypothetical protein
LILPPYLGAEAFLIIRLLDGAPAEPSAGWV